MQSELNKAMQSKERPPRHPRRSAGGEGRVRGARTRAFAKDLRRASSDAERILWGLLRNRRLNGYKFRRQSPMGPYIVDFLSVERQLVVELDGGQHVSRTAYGDIRTRFLNENGYRVLRFWNNEMLGQTEAVLEEILRALQAPSPFPLPHKKHGGEGNSGERR